MTNRIAIGINHPNLSLVKMSLLQRTKGLDKTYFRIQLPAGVSHLTICLS